jgi:hypothetical protein
MGRHAEQLSRGARWYSKNFTRRIREWVKRELRRARRRAERKDPENVPPRLTKGWAD